MVCPSRWGFHDLSGDDVVGGAGSDYRLEKLKVPGGILLTIIGISIVGLIFDPNVHFSGVFAMPSLSDENGNSLIGSLDIMGALNPVVLPSVLALVMTAVFDATGTIRAVAGQANLLDKDGQIIDGGKALTTDSMSSVFWPRGCSSGSGIHRVCGGYGGGR